MLQSLCISVPTTWRDVGPFLWPSSSTRTPHIIHKLVWQFRPLRIDRTPVLVNHGHPVGNIDRLGNKTNQQISGFQTMIQELGWRMEGDSLWRATRIREFPRVAVMDGRMLTAENEMGCCLNSLTQTEEHGNLSCFAYVFHLSLYLLSPSSISTLCYLSLVTTRNISFYQHPPSQDQLNLHFWIAITRVKIHL